MMTLVRPLALIAVAGLALDTLTACGSGGSANDSATGAAADGAATASAGTPSSVTIPGAGAFDDVPVTR